MKTTQEAEVESNLGRVAPLTQDEKSRLGEIAQQLRAFGEQMDRLAAKIDKASIVPYTRLSAWAELAEFVADWIQLDERDPTLQIIARTGPRLSELVMPHIKSYVIQAELVAEAQQAVLERHMKRENENGNTGTG